MPPDLDADSLTPRVTPFLIASYWACLPSFPGGFVFPKMAGILLWMLIYALRHHRRAQAFLLVAAFSAAYSINPTLSVIGLPGFWTYGLMSMACYCLLMTMDIGTSWLKWLGVLLSIHALAQQLNLDPLVGKAVLQSGRSVAWIGSPIDLGALLAMAAPVSGAWLPLILMGLLASGSRGAMLAVLFAFGSNRARLLLLPLLFIPLVLKSPKDVARVELCKTAWTGFKERPWLGQGPNTFTLVFDRLKTKRLVEVVEPNYRQAHAHNDLFEMLCSTGILGLIGYLLLLWPLRRSQSLVALFVVLKYNPVSFEVLAAAALIAGHELAKRGGQGVFKPQGPASLVSPSAPYPPEQALAYREVL